MDPENKSNVQNSTGNIMKEYQIQLLSDCTNNLETGQRRRLKFKSPGPQKRLKTELETKESEANQKSVLNNFEKKDNMPRRSKRKKNQISSTETTEKLSENALENGMKYVHNKTTESNLNLISQSTVKNFDKASSPGNTEEMKMNSSVEDIAEQDQLSITPNNLNECLLTNEDDKTAESNLNLISQGITENLGKTFHPEDRKSNPSAEDIAEHDQLSIKPNNLNECHSTIDNEIAISKNILEDSISKKDQNLRKESTDSERPYLPNKILTNFENGILEKDDAMTEIRENKNSETNMTVKLTFETKNEKYDAVTEVKNNFMNIKDNGCILNKNDITKSIIPKKFNCENKDMQIQAELINNECLENDDSLDQLYIGIERADAIINLLENVNKAEETCIGRNCIKEKNTEEYNQKNNISENNTKLNNFQNENELSEGPFAENVKSGQNPKGKAIKIKNIGEKNYEINEKATQFNLNVKENIKAESTSVLSTAIVGHDMDLNSLAEEHFGEINPNFDKSYSTQLDSNTLESNANIFILRNGEHSHLTENSNMGPKFIQNSEVSFNETAIKMQSGKKHDTLHMKIHDSNENSGLKQKKLTLLYMNALDYENEELIERNEDSYTQEFNSSKNDDIERQKNLETCGHDLETSKLKEKSSISIPYNLSDKNINMAGNFVEENTKQLIYDKKIVTCPSINNEQHQMNGDRITMGLDDFNDNKGENLQTFNSGQNDTSQFYNKKPLTQWSTDELMQVEIIEDMTEIENTGKCYNHNGVTPVAKLDLEHKNFVQNISSSTDENITESDKDVKNSKEESRIIAFEKKNATPAVNGTTVSGICPKDQKAPPRTQDPEENFDMDDDFNLTASQINMIEANEENELKESKVNYCQETEGCSNTHFGLDSITVEIIDQLAYIRESIESIKKLLSTHLKKED